MDAEAIAARILQARSEGRTLDSEEIPIGPDMAYSVQQVLTQRRRDRGERQIGWKLGYTSDAMRAQMGIDRPNLGPLTDAMLLTDGARIVQDGPLKVEPEIAFVIDRPVAVPIGVDACRHVVRSAHLALEVVESVWRDFRFTWSQNTADGSSAAYLVLGPAIDRTHLTDLAVRLERNGALAGNGVGAAAMGDPYLALSWLTEQLPTMTASLQPGDIVLTGGLCAAVDLTTGDTVRAATGAAQVSVRR